MTRKVARRRARLDALTEELSVGAALRLRCDSDDIHAVVSAVVSYLVEQYPAQEIYIPAAVAPKPYPVDSIRRAIEAGQSIRLVCRRFKVDRRTVYRLLALPGKVTAR